MLKVAGSARSDSKRLVWGQRTKRPGLEFQVGVAVEKRARAMETQRCKTSSTKLRNWLERKQAGFALVSLWCFQSHHGDNARWEVKVTLCLKVDSQHAWT